MSLDYLNQGTDATFDPFMLSQYSVSQDVENSLVIIGCKSYSIAGMLVELHELLYEGKSTTDLFTTTEDGFAHGRFGITADDTQLLYDTLIKIKLQ
jgi:hypothetical protein